MKDALIVALGGLVLEEVSAGQLMGHIVAVMTDLLEADRGTIFLVDEQADELVSTRPILPDQQPIRVPMTHGVAGYVARTGKVVNIPFCGDDVHHWPRIDDITGYDTRTLLAAPLYNGPGQLLGVVEFLNKRDGIFTDHDEAALQELVEQVAQLLAETTLSAGSPAPDDASVGPEADTEADSLPLGDQINRIVGRSPGMRQLFAGVRRAAQTEATVLVRGESGTGKGLIARALHVNSLRSGGRLVRVDCTTLPESLIDNELFGHDPGAYTGAGGRRRGRVESARGGTLFLDEVGDLPLPVQGKLLGLLQERTYVPLGSAETVSADVRIVAATNRDLESLVEQGRFRGDLYYRLRVVELVVPPLRERGPDDLLRLVEYFIARHARRHDRPAPSLSPAARERLLAHPWPGNVRELEHTLESAIIFADAVIEPEHLPILAVLGGAGAESPAPSPFADLPTLDMLERRYLLFLLRRHDGNRSAVARTLSIGRARLLRKLREYGLDDR